MEILAKLLKSFEQVSRSRHWKMVCVLIRLPTLAMRLELVPEVTSSSGCKVLVTFVCCVSKNFGYDRIDSYVIQCIGERGCFVSDRILYLQRAFPWRP
jgi:hypothetical protein